VSENGDRILLSLCYEVSNCPLEGQNNSAKFNPAL